MPDNLIKVRILYKVNISDIDKMAICLSDKVAIRVNPHCPKEIFKYLSMRTDMLKYIDNLIIKGYFAAAFSPGRARLRARFTIGPRYRQGR